MSACRRLRQENCCKFEANLGYLSKACLKNKNALLPKSAVDVLVFCIFLHPPRVTAEMAAEAVDSVSLLILTVCMEHQRRPQRRGQGLCCGSNDCMAWLCVPQEGSRGEVALASWSLFFREG